MRSGVNPVQRTGFPDGVVTMFSGVSAGTLSRQESLNTLLGFPVHQN